MIHSDRPQKMKTGKAIVTSRDRRAASSKQWHEQEGERRESQEVPSTCQFFTSAWLEHTVVFTTVLGKSQTNFTFVIVVFERLKAMKGKQASWQTSVIPPLGRPRQGLT